MQWFFDTLIVVFLLVDALLAVTLAHQFLHHRRESKERWRFWLPFSLFVVVALAGLVVIYGSFIEPRIITVRHETLALRPDGTNTMRIALLSDFHTGPYSSEGFVRRVVRRTEVEKPDVVLLAGDYISFGEGASLPQMESVAELTAPLGVYAVLGNHDYIRDVAAVRAMLESFGVEVLANEHAIIGEGERAVAIVGVDDLWFGTVDLEAAARDIPAEMPRLLLAHNPDIVHALRDFRFDAILAGHTHAGQIRLPGIGPIPPLPTALGRDYDRGIFDWNGMPLVITQGLGETGPRARLFAPPEILILDITF